MCTMNQDKRKVADRNKCITIIAEKQQQQEEEEKEKHAIQSTIVMTKEKFLITKSANIEQDEENYGNAAVAVAAADVELKNIIKISNNMELSEEASRMELMDKIDALNYEQFAHDACLNSSRVVDDNVDVEEACTPINKLQEETEEGAEDCLLTIAKKNLEHRLYKSLSTIDEAHNEVDENHNAEKTIAKDSGKNDESEKLQMTISPKPACSSKGFENTFSILQQQVATGVDGSHDKSIIHNAFQDIQGFELEYLARERLLGLWNELDKILSKDCWNLTQNKLQEELCKMSAPSILPFLYDFTMAKEILPKNYRTISEHNKFERLKLLCHAKSEQHNIRYHAAVDANGKKCLHILRPSRSLNDEQGKNSLL